MFIIYIKNNKNKDDDDDDEYDDNNNNYNDILTLEAFSLSGRRISDHNDRMPVPSFIPVPFNIENCTFFPILPKATQ